MLTCNILRIREPPPRNPPRCCIATCTSTPNFPQTARNHQLRAIIADIAEKNQKRCPVFATFALRAVSRSPTWLARVKRWPARDLCNAQILVAVSCRLRLQTLRAAQRARCRAARRHAARRHGEQKQTDPTHHSTCRPLDSAAGFQIRTPGRFRQTRRSLGPAAGNVGSGCDAAVGNT